MHTKVFRVAAPSAQLRRPCARLALTIAMAVAHAVSQAEGAEATGTDETGAATPADAATATARPQDGPVGTGLRAASLAGDELRASPFIRQVRATTAYQSGAAGRGVVVAVLDTGLDGTHTEFAGRVMPGLNATGVGGDAVVTDGHGHGTHVAGLIAAAADHLVMRGVAHRARLLPVKVLRNDGTGHTGMVDTALRWVTGRADIANLSLSGSIADSPAALQAAVQGGLLVVAAAGNEGLANPGWPARHARETWANNQIIAVGAVDSQNRIAWFSNRAGDAAAWFLVAPGTDLLSTAPGGGYAYMSGTSMAAPIVSGAAALVKSRWRYLRADQVANVLFVTATDLGARGIDRVYGRGLLNVDAAMRPVGNLTTITWSGRRVRAIDTTVSPTPATGGLWAVALGGGFKVSAYDALQRDFDVDLGQVVARPEPLSMHAALAPAEGAVAVLEQALPGGGRLTLARERPGAPARAAAQAGLASAEPDSRLLAFSYVQRDAQGRDWTVGSGWADHYFGLTGSAAGQPLQGQPALASPFLGLVPNAAYAGASLPFGRLRAKVGLLSNAPSGALRAQWAAAPLQGGAGAPAVAAGAVVELGASLGGVDLSLGWTGTRERSRFLGAYTAGALALADTARTRGLTAGAAWRLAPGWAAGAQWSQGRTGGYGDADSLITGLSAQRTEGHGLALVGSDRWGRGDRLSLTASQPLRAGAGSASYDAMTGVDGAGRPVRSQRTLSLVPDGRERLFALGYGRPWSLPGGHSAWVDLTLAHRRDPGHQARLADETALMLRLQTAF